MKQLWDVIGSPAKHPTSEKTPHSSRSPLIMPLHTVCTVTAQRQCTEPAELLLGSKSSLKGWAMGRTKVHGSGSTHWLTNCCMKEDMNTLPSVVAHMKRQAVCCVQWSWLLVTFDSFDLRFLRLIGVSTHNVVSLNK